MKKLFLLLLPLLLLHCLFTFGQSKQSKIILKNGTELIGQIKSIDPNSDVKIIISGIETSINFVDISKIEEVQDVKTVPIKTSKLTKTDKLVVTDFAEYPDSFKINIGDNTISMILVRGGDMNMGYNGKGSMSMNSEPVHKVSVTTFYMSKTFVTSEIVKYLNPRVVSSRNIFNPKGYLKRKYNRKYYIGCWEDISIIIDTIRTHINLPVRLPTEAEWEFAACSEMQNIIFSDCIEEEFCSDYYNEEYNSNYIVDPTGPKKGDERVLRQFCDEDEDEKKDILRYARSGISETNTIRRNNFRLVIKAKDLPK